MVGDTARVPDGRDIARITDGRSTARAPYGRDYREYAEMDITSLEMGIRDWIKSIDPLWAGDVVSYLQGKFNTALCVKGRLCDKLKNKELVDGSLVAIPMIMLMIGLSIMTPVAMIAAFLVKYGLKKFCKCN